jgi:hypothetical protein
MDLGGTEYHDGGAERIRDASLLLAAGHFAGSAYLGGRGVEGMLRALLWKFDPMIKTGRKTLETGHDLRELLTEIGNLGLLRRGTSDEELRTRVNRIARLWSNNLRFAAPRLLERRWRAAREISKERTFKQAAIAFHNDCLAIAKRCEVLWLSR